MSHVAPTILVVDDEEHIRLMLRASLESEGFAIREASGAAEAIESIEDESPNIVLLDLWMPGEHGMSVLEHLSHRPTEQRPGVIVLTAHGGVPETVKAMRLGAADFLEKPTTPEQLRLSVDAALKEQQARSAANHPPAPRPIQVNVSYSETLLRLQQAVWKSDINLTEQILTDCLRKAGGDPTFYNVVGVVFEAQGNLQTAKTFYQKAQAIPGGYEPASQNLQRLELIAISGAAQGDVALGDHARFIDDICAPPHFFGAPPAAGTIEAVRDQV
jgi:DNA-binding response OmpR family regulator